MIISGILFILLGISITFYFIRRYKNYDIQINTGFNWLLVLCLIISLIFWAFHPQNDLRDFQKEKYNYHAYIHLLEDVDSLTLEEKIDLKEKITGYNQRIINDQNYNEFFLKYYRHPEADWSSLKMIEFEDILF